MIRRLLLTSSLAALSACVTPPAPEPTFEDAAFVAAIPLEEPTPERVEIVETPVPLPLPGQMKPLDAKPAKPAKPLAPGKAIEKGRSGALVEPSLDGFVNAVQVYPYTEGALYRLYASPGQVSDIALQPGADDRNLANGGEIKFTQSPVNIVQMLGRFIFNSAEGAGQPAKN